ncbi:MAG: response regulator [Verrucomicrobiota bacterium]
MFPSMTNQEHAHEIDPEELLRHDLRTPVNFIISCGELMREEYSRDNHAELHAGLSLLIDSAHAASREVDRYTDAGEDTRPVELERLESTAADMDARLEKIMGSVGDTDAAGALEDLEAMLGAVRRLAESLRRSAAAPEPDDLDASDPSGEGWIGDGSGLLRKTPRVLVVDDTEDNRLIIQRMLEPEGYELSEAADGREALEKLEAEDFDMLLLDIMMPEVTGFEVLERVREKPALARTPIIVLTALTDVESVVRCIQLGAEDYLTKPLKSVLLKTRIQSVLRRREAQLKVRQLGSYTLEKLIGEGGMAKVYLARHVMLKRPTAVKVLEKTRPEVVKMFQREVLQTCRLSHPNTISIYDYGLTPDGRFFYAMEYLNGITLKELLTMIGPLPQARACHILAQICASLGEAHGYGLIHRDIKPANILLGERGGQYDTVKVCDFGLVTFFSDTHEPARKPMVMGTPAFMPPEAFELNGRLDPRSDIYSLGVLAYLLLTGRSLFTVMDKKGLADAHRNTLPVRPSHHMENLSPGLEKVILRCLKKKPEDRFQSAMELRKALLDLEDVGSWNEDHARAWWRKHLHERMEQNRWSPESGDTEEICGRLVIHQ